MKSVHFVFWVVALSLTATLVQAGGGRHGHPPSGTIGMTINVTDAWVEAPAAGQTDAPLYMEISSGTDGSLISAFSRAAKSVQVRTGPGSGVIAVDSGKPTVLARDGSYLLLVGVTEPLTKDSIIPVTLTFFGKDGQRQTVQIDARVR